MGNVIAKTSGDIASFMTPAETNIKSLKVHFSPKQLGEGDPSPENVREIVGWDGVEVNGCGKNIAHIVGYSAINSDSNNSRTISNEYGTTINTTEFSLPDTELVVTQTQYPNTSSIPHYQNGYLAVLVDNLIWGQKYNVSFKINNIINNPLNVDLKNIKLLNPYGTFYSSVVIDNNRVVFKNVLWKQYSNTAVNRRNFEIRICGMSFTLSEFMVTPIDKDNFEYEPYKGDIYSESWTKNLLDIWEKPNGYTPSKYTNGNYDWSKEWIITDELRGKTVTYSAFIDNTNVSSSGYVHIWTKDSEGNFIKTNIIPLSNKQIIAGESGWSYVKLTLTSDIYSVVFGITIPANATAKYPMVELGSEPTEYQPYVGTVYGGYVDLISGELVETHLAFIMDGINHKVTAGGNINSNNNMARAHSFIGRTGIEDLPLGKNNKGLYAINKYIRHGMENGSSDTAVEGVYCGTGTPYVRIVTSVDNLSDSSTTSNVVNSINEWLSENPIQICYEVAEPITHQLTPTQLQSFIGQNNFWSNADYVEIEYDLIETEDIQKARKKIILNQPHIESVKDNSISFNTDLRAPLKECKVYFEPVQEGEGDPSPDNVRNITGWNGVEVKNGDNVYSIDWTDEIGTVYGGYVDLVKGEVVAEWEMAQGKWGDIKSSTAVSSTGYYTGKFSYNNTIKISHYQSSYYKNSICNITNTIIWQTGEKTPEHFYCENNSNTNKGKAYIFGNYDDDVTIQIIVKLAEPIHYSLTPQQILSLKGINNFSCGIKNDLSVRYWNYKKSNSSNIAYEAKNLTFDGTNYIDTGVYLFSEKNINRDFEVVIEDLYGGDPSNKTIVCAKHDSTAIGFLIRLNSAVGTIYNGTISMKQNNYNNITIKRVNGAITISGSKITNPKVKFTNAVHQHPLVLGCALQDDGIPFRYQAGTIGHITVKWL